MTTHTPGPWTIRTDSRTDIDRTVFAHTPIHNNPVAIARVYGEGVMASPDAEKIANARLIAAAPDLLAACQRALDSSVRINWERLREAVALATEGGSEPDEPDRAGYPDLMATDYREGLELGHPDAGR